MAKCRMCGLAPHEGGCTVGVRQYEHILTFEETMLQRIAVALEKIAEQKDIIRQDSEIADAPTRAAITRSNDSACGHCGCKRHDHWCAPGKKIHTGACQNKECTANCGMFI